MQSQEVYGPQNNGYHRHNIHRSLNNHSKTFTLSLLAITYNVSFIFIPRKANMLHIAGNGNLQNKKKYIY